VFRPALALATTPRHVVSKTGLPDSQDTSRKTTRIIWRTQGQVTGSMPISTQYLGHRFPPVMPIKQPYSTDGCPTRKPVIQFAHFVSQKAYSPFF